MWLWQRNVPDRQLWRDLMIFVLVTHLIVLFLLLYVYRGGTPYHIHVGNVNRSAEVIFLPLQKSVRSGMSGGIKNGTKNGKSVARNKVKPQKKERPQKKKKGVTLKKEPIKAAKKKKQEKKQKKIAQPKPEPVIEKQKIEEPKPEPIPEPILEQVPDVAVAIETQADIVESALPEGGPVYVGQAEMDALQMEQLIQQEVEKHWKPPVGVDSDLVCQIAVTVDWTGKAQAIRVIKKSGILMYDVHARSTVQAMNFPACSYGKELMLHFKQ